MREVAVDHWRPVHDWTEAHMAAITITDGIVLLRLRGRLSSDVLLVIPVNDAAKNEFQMARPSRRPCP